MAYRVTLGNNKGGSGKTCATVNLAAALANQGLRVLVVDMDPQANASRRLGWTWDPAAPTPTVSEAIKAAEDGVAADAVVPCSWEQEFGARIRLLPARWDLENRISEAGTVGAVGRLRRAMAGVDDDIDVDVTLFDCPPSLGHLAQLAMAASHAVVCTVEPEYDSVQGALRYRDFVTHHARDLGNPDLVVAGYLVSRVRGVGAHEYQLEGFSDLFGAAVWEPHIPERTIHKDAADAALPLYALRTTASREMAALWGQLASTLTRHTKKDA